MADAGRANARAVMRLHAVRAFLGRNAMPAVSVLAALVTCCLVPPDAAYAGYIDWPTLGRLACTLAVVAALHRTGAFRALAARVAARCRSARMLVCALVGACGIASMFVTNDMALLAMLPLAAASLVSVGRRDLIARTFVLQGLAANLWGMVMPFGNPQNIFLVQRYGLDLGSFVGAMAGPFALSLVLVGAGCWAAAGSEPVRVVQEPPAVPRARTCALGGLLALCVASVLGVVPVPLACAAVLAGLLALDRGFARRTDWGLIVTFAAFFVFSGNLARIDAARDAFAGLLAGGAFVPAALVSQVISNVPAAILLAQFTGDWRGLLAGVNVGGAGTPVASLATLIVIGQFQAFTRELGGGAQAVAEGGRRADAGVPAGAGGRLDGRRFMALLLAANAACLAALLAAGVLAGW